MVIPVSGISPVTPPATTKTCSAIADESPTANSLPNGSRAARAVRRPRCTSRAYSRKIAIRPVSPSSSPNEPRMKSLFAAKLISQERPWPRPEPVTPPEPSAISDWPICSVAPFGGCAPKAAIGSSQASMRTLTWLVVMATATAPPIDISRPNRIQLVRSVAT